jgi:pyrimidine-nucleoside phosphorylase
LLNVAPGKTLPNCLTISPAEFIEIKASGGEYSDKLLFDFLSDANQGLIDDGQLGSWLMAVRLKGMTPAETTALTIGMARSGRELDMSSFNGPVIDKHSTGGVGDKVTLIIGPLLAAAGVFMPKLSGRGLGFTGGTIDKLESIPGFNCGISVEQLISQTHRIGLAIGAQTSELAPLDGKLYAMRDVTATVQSTPLIAASVMSKKLAAGAKIIILDVTCGAGAFMTNRRDAAELAALMVKIGKGAGRQVRALVTNMEEPLGSAVGNALEVKEAIEVLSGINKFPDVRQIVLELGAVALIEAGLDNNLENARQKLAALLDNGKALEKFAQLIEAQGGNAKVIENLNLLGSCPTYITSGIKKEGYVEKINPMAIALASMELGAGRKRKGDSIDHQVGIEVMAKVGNRVSIGQNLIKIHARSEQGKEMAKKLEETAFIISDKPVEAPLLILDAF